MRSQHKQVTVQITKAATESANKAWIKAVISQPLLLQNDLPHKKTQTDSTKTKKNGEYPHCLLMPICLQSSAGHIGGFPAFLRGGASIFGRMRSLSNMGFQL